MYIDSESWTCVKKIILHACPLRICLKFRIEDNVLIATSQDRSLHFLNKVSKEFYLLCDGNNSTENIVHILESKFDVEYDILENDIISLVRNLQKRRLLRISPEECFYE